MCLKAVYQHAVDEAQLKLVCSSLKWPALDVLKSHRRENCCIIPAVAFNNTAQPELLDSFTL